MSARMDNVRAALESLDHPSWGAALAEVEEWEARAAQFSRYVGGPGATQSIADLLARSEAAEAERDTLKNALTALRELFVDLRGDWSDNRGPCREGISIIDALKETP